MAEKYKIETRCLRCNAEYLSRAKQGKEPPKRCKKCKSSKTAINPDAEVTHYEVN